ncbi:MAG TPA: DUF892 family protein [Phototrophicaceae bacterium]|nr:DUF892 family protein [Phototrophicaceae bacterium]
MSAYVNQFGFDDALDLLQQTLDEATRTDEQLSQLAESSVNIQAAS